MQKLQSQGVHHITLVGADRQTSIDFWEGLLGMPFVFEQPNLDNPQESHLYFDPGDGRLITVFTNEERDTGSADGPLPTPAACTTSRSHSLRRPSTRPSNVWTCTGAGSSTAASRTEGSWIRSTSTTRSDSQIELAAYRFHPPPGFTHAEVLLDAHRLRFARGDHASVPQVHLADAIEDLVVPLAGVAVGRPVGQEPVLTS